MREAKKSAKKKKSSSATAPPRQQTEGKKVSGGKGSTTEKKVANAAKDKRITAQQSIPYHEMGRDGICRVQDKFYSKTIRFYDINYQLAQNEDKNAIFENWCDFLNYFDSTIHFQLSFINQHSNMAEYEKVIHINPQEDEFDDLRMEFAQMLNNQLAKGNNGLMRTKYITFGIEAENIREARPKLERIESDIMNNFKILGVTAYPLNGAERLQIMYETFNQDSKVPFHFSYDEVLRTGLSTKDYIAPTSFVFKNGKDFQMGGTIGAVSYLQILAPELTDKMLAEFLEMDSNLMVNFHIQSIDQMKAIKLVKSKVTDINRMKIEEQKKAVRAGYDMDIIPSDLNTYGGEAKRLLEDLQSRNERMFLVTALFLNTAETKQELENVVFQTAGIAQKYNCALKRLDYQQEAIDNLKKMREDGKTIALLYHATGVGKTITAATDAKAVGGRTLFLVNALKLASQAKETFAKVWPEATLGEYTGSQKDMTQTVIFATVQSISKDLEKFSPTDFDYLIVDECHHAAANTYQKIFTYFHPKFILGLTATPERSDGEDMLELFQNVAHKMDLKTAVERGVLVSIRCIRVKTNIDLTDVRINGIKYNSQDLESKLFIPERNQLIVDTYLKYVNDKKTVIFCASVDHAAEIAKLLRDSGVKAEAVSGRDRVEVREKILKDYETGSTNVLCACDLLNEGWDSPHTTVLFMARPTMSKTIYLQQLGRGTRRCPGKEDLLVVDFVDNANMFNMPYSLHRALDISKYQPMAYVLAPENKRKLDQDMLFKREKPEAWLDVPIDVDDYEIIDLFNWQNSVKDMISQIEFVRMVDVQSETVERYIKDGKVKPDLSIPFGDKRMFHYFREESIRNIAKQYGWDLITPQNMADKFMKFIETMDMSFSYKPVLLKAIYEYMDSNGRVALPDVVDYFIDFYEDRKAHGMIAEKSTSIYQKDGYTRKDVEKNILSNPFKRFEDMRFLMRCKDVETVEVNPIIFRKLTREDWLHIVDVCDRSLEKYYMRFKK